MSELHHFVIVRTRLGAMHAELLSVDDNLDAAAGVVNENALEQQARKLCEDVIAVQSGERVSYGIVCAKSLDDARANVKRIAWLGGIYFNDSNS